MEYSYNLPKVYVNNSVYSAQNVGFRQNGYTTYNPNYLRKDSFNSNPLYDNTLDKNKIEALVRSNSQIMGILNEHNIPVKINTKELKELQKGHLQDTRVIAAKIYSALPKEIKQEVNLIDLQEAAMLHDYGKILIPESILNKKGSLTPKEKDIMELHSELGYELLKQQGVKENVLNLVKYHHQTPDGRGYPVLDDNYEYGYDNQILNVADKYSALTEKRSYKDALSKEEALQTIAHDVDCGNVSPEIYQALKKVV